MLFRARALGSGADQDSSGSFTVVPEWGWRDCRGQRGPQSLTLGTLAGLATEKWDRLNWTLGRNTGTQKLSPAFTCQPTSRTQLSSCWSSEDWGIPEATFQGWAAPSSTDGLHRTPARTQALAEEGQNQCVLTRLVHGVCRVSCVVLSVQPVKTPWCPFPAPGKWAFGSILSGPRVPES